MCCSSQIPFVAEAEAATAAEEKAAVTVAAGAKSRLAAVSQTPPRERAWQSNHTGSRCRSRQCYCRTNPHASSSYGRCVLRRKFRHRQPAYYSRAEVVAGTATVVAAKAKGVRVKEEEVREAVQQPPTLGAESLSTRNSP